MTQPYDVVHASRQYQDWLAALKQEASLVTHNQSQAMMRAVMHELRSCLGPDDVLRVANALPALPRGILLEGWSLSDRVSTPATADAFHEGVFERIKAHHTPPADIVPATFRVWQRFLDRRDAAIIEECLPDALKPVWPPTDER